MSAIPPISGIPAFVQPASPIQKAPEAPTQDGSFASSVRKALESVSAAEHEVDRIAVDIASGGESEVHELMVASAKASLSVDLLVQVRNRAVESYQEIMRMQI
jgi:flagellar hook-basal body complex protein FliE